MRVLVRRVAFRVECAAERDTAQRLASFLGRPSLPAGVERAGFRGRLRGADVAFVVDESADRIGLGLVVAGADQHGRRFVKAAAFAVVAPPADHPAQHRIRFGAQLVFEAGIAAEGCQGGLPTPSVEGHGHHAVDGVVRYLIGMLCEDVVEGDGL